ncbi:hypothetical protein [Streptomyces sp. NPDC058308]|uniref:hypothetical protein n=1 Tax=Streptomyces sp. NPDC058308 TaxID=3346440 RepID=UPI0036EDDBDB
MNNSKRMFAALTLAAAAASVAAAAPAHAASSDEGHRSVGRTVGDSLADPATTGKQVLDGGHLALEGGKTALTVADAGLRSVKTSSDSFSS